MSGGLVTNFFLEDYATQHRDSLRAKAAAEGRTLSVENPEARRHQQEPRAKENNSTAADEKKQSSSWWSSLQKKTSSSSKKNPSTYEADVKSLNSFSSGDSY